MPLVDVRPLQIILGFKQMTHVIFHTFWGYLMVLYFMQMERFSFPREYIRDAFGRETSCFLFGLIFYLTVPVLCVLQNSLIMIIVNIRGCKERVSPFDKDNWLTPTLLGQIFSTLSVWPLSCHTIFPLLEVVQRTVGGPLFCNFRTRKSYKIRGTLQNKGNILCIQDC